MNFRLRNFVSFAGKVSTAAIFVALLAFLIANLIYIISSNANLSSALRSIGLNKIADIVYEPKKTFGISADAYENVFPDHLAISRWLAACLGVSDLEKLPTEIRDELSFPRLNIYYGQGKTEVRRMGRQESRLAYLNSTLSSQRMNSKARADTAFFYWQIASVSSVILGLLTTIIVSISTTEIMQGVPIWQNAIRILAIIFPALGTALAAVIAFYGPQAEWSQSTRNLASLTQLHRQIALDIWKKDCAMPGADKQGAELAGSIDGWSKTYVDIQTVSTAAPGSGASGGSNQGFNGGAGGVAKTQGEGDAK